MLGRLDRMHARVASTLAALVVSGTVGCTAVVDLEHLRGDEVAEPGADTVEPGADVDPTPEPQPLPDEEVVTDACANSLLVGSWLASDMKVGETLRFEPDCSGWDGACGAAFVYEPVEATSGLVNVEVLSSEQISCPQPGTYACSYLLIANEALVFDCGYGEQTYGRVD